MKKIQLIFLLLFIVNYLSAQDGNYFKEAKQLSVLQFTQLRNIHVHLENGRPVPDNKAGFNNIVTSMTALVRKPETQRVNDPYSTTNPPATGAIIPAPVVTSDTTLSDEDKMVLEKEILYAAWLVKVKNEAELLQARDFPEKFVFLENIRNGFLKGIGNSKMEGGNFAFSETAIIYGVTDFIIKRAKEELVEVYLQNWYEKLNNDPVLAPMLVQTLSVTKAFVSDGGLSLARYGDKWKAAIQEDLRHIPELLEDTTYVSIVLDHMKKDISATDKKELIASITGSAELIGRLYLKEHVVNAVASMSARYSSADTVFKNNPLFPRMIVLSDIVMKVAGRFDDDQTYMPVKIEDVKDLNMDSWMIMLKLVYARNNIRLQYVMDEGGSLGIFGPDSLRKVEAFKNLVNETITRLQTYQYLISLKNNEKLSFDDTRKFFEAGFGLFDNISRFMVFCKIEEGISYTQQIKPYLRYATEMGEGISTQQYGKVLDGALGILTKVNTNDTITGNLQRYGSFMLNILSAKESTDVEAALDELIPKGTYQLKNTKRLAVSISAFPGVMIGTETIRKYPYAVIAGADKKADTKFSVAPYLPIGLDFSFHTRSKEKLQERAKQNKYGSMNIGIQLVDLGAVLNYRISGDSTVSSSPEISWQQLLSPGAQVMWHFTNSPIVVGAGVNYTPSLRKIDQAGLSYSSNALRFGIFMGVDVTLFHLHLSRKNSGEK